MYSSGAYDQTNFR
jgi:serine/threonine protein kinase